MCESLTVWVAVLAADRRYCSDFIVFANTKKGTTSNRSAKLNLDATGYTVCNYLILMCVTNRSETQQRQSLAVIRYAVRSRWKRRVRVICEIIKLFISHTCAARYSTPITLIFVDRLIVDKFMRLKCTWLFTTISFVLCAPSIRRQNIYNNQSENAEVHIYRYYTHSAFPLSFFAMHQFSCSDTTNAQAHTPIACGWHTHSHRFVCAQLIVSSVDSRCVCMCVVTSSRINTNIVYGRCPNVTKEHLFWLLFETRNTEYEHNKNEWQKYGE